MSPQLPHNLLQPLKNSDPASSAFKQSNPKDLLGAGKVPMATVSALVLKEVGVAMLEGATKYGRHNYRGVGVRASVYYDAAQRHLMDWWEGQDIDPDSGLSHITKCITALIVLRDAMLMQMWEDDRPPRHPNLEALNKELTAAVAKIKEQYGHLKPKHYTEINRNTDEAYR